MRNLNDGSTYLKLSAMKTILFFLMCMIVSLITLGQENKGLNEASISPPKFIGTKGIYPAVAQNTPGTIENYLSSNIQFPEKAIGNLIQGTSVIQFVVTEKGTVSDLKIINSVSKEIDDEVIRVLKTTDGMWEPGKFNKEPVAVEKEISVAFKNSELGNYTDFMVLGRKYFSKGSDQFFVHNNPKKALKYYDNGVIILPKDKGLLLVRGMARYEVGDMKGACQDWNRIKALGGLESDYYLNNLCGYKGYAEMIEILKK
jgi:TonB family protein